MNQLPQIIWNQIAYEQPLKTKWGKKMFNLTEKEIDKEMDKEARQLSQKGYSNKAITAYLTVLPMLLENEAIRTFMQTEDNLDLMQMMPEIYSAEEAVRLMTAEYRLMDNQQRELMEMLKAARAKVVLS